MRFLARMMLVAVSAVGAVFLSSANAQTPPPSSTPTPLPMADPAQTSVFMGNIWSASFGFQPGFVTAKVGETLCGQEVSCETCVRAPVNPPPLTFVYRVYVLPASVEPGCGVEGVSVTLFVGETPVRQKAVWHKGVVQNLDLFTGPDFAFFQGQVAFSDGMDPSLGSESPLMIDAFVDGRLCGHSLFGVLDGRTYDVQVSSQDGQTECGTEGAEVTFKMVDPQGNIVGVAREKGVWHAWGQGNTGQDLNLTMDPVMKIRAGNVGEGPSRSEVPWVNWVVVLAVAGLLCVSVTATLRRRIWTR